ncbi:MAG: M1 family peptidase [Acidobacteriota bacterium]
MNHLRYLRFVSPWLATLFVIALAAPANAGPRLRKLPPPPHHAVSVQLDIAAASIEVEDVITLKGGVGQLELAAHLEILSSEPELSALDGAPGDEGTVATVLLQPPAGTERVAIRYRGAYGSKQVDPRGRLADDARRPLGTIETDGLFLSGGSHWLPMMEGRPVTFELEVSGLPDGWHVISSGEGTSRDGEPARARWSTGVSMEQVYLVGGPLERYVDRFGEIETLAYFRKPEPVLAATYLETTAQYLEMYRQLLGEYPYEKFAMVENFWETGYGMPSFTVLGSRVVRFPFILHSSYPHELLHSYWGHAVGVDWETGNWSEGLTTYLGDHLIQEQRARGAEYRHDILKRYADYVERAEDFPLRDFRSRYDAETQAVGYGKTLMGFHMIRRLLGDRNFTGVLKSVYKVQRGRTMGFGDWRVAVEAPAPYDLGAFFKAWVDRPGAPVLEVEGVEVAGLGRGFRVTGTLKNTGAPWPLEVPITVTSGGEVTTNQIVRLHGESADFEILVETAPLRLDVDPEFDVFRRLDPQESAPSLGTLFGSSRSLAIVPDDSPRYRTIVDAWTGAGRAMETVEASQLKALPADRAVWILGAENPWAAKAGFGASRSVDGQRLPAGDASRVEVRRHPDRADLAVGWIWTDRDAAAPGLARKLPHYGKYSALGFVGDEPRNTAKVRAGRSDDSPLVIHVGSLLGQMGGLPDYVPESRAPLVKASAPF